MSASQMLGRISASPISQQLAAELLVDVSQTNATGQFLELALPKVIRACEATAAAIYRPDYGQWNQRFATSSLEGIDTTLLAEALDRDQPVVKGLWGVAPLVNRSQLGDCLAIKFKSPSPDSALVDSLAALVGVGLENVQSRQGDIRRVRRLEAILEIAGQWNQNLEMESLLLQMAETSTRLLESERASIFLWDRTNRILLGRPALGVDGDELRIPDNQGIVGEVVQSGELRRVDESEEDAIARDVDKQLGFHTRTLLCVPLRSAAGKIVGAFEMINKKQGNFTKEDEAGLVELASHAAIALENTQHFQQVLDSKKQIAQQAADQVQMIGDSVPIEQLRNTVRRVADTDLALLVLGENGTGKEVVSQMVHYLSARRDEPFIAVNCAALSETLLESELFGHERGAFTDAHEARQGKFELASGGTLFLDEIGDLSLAGQAKLLRVLEEKIVVRVGGSIPIPIDARVIAATNQNLAEMVKEKRFREDLFFRLNVVTLDLPPLRNRVDDIMLLAQHFLADFANKARRPPPKFTPEAVTRMRQHPWPGNVRELRNLMERLAYLTQDDQINADDLAFILAPDRDSAAAISMDLSLTDATKQFQTDYIRKHIEAAAGNMSDAARRMGLHRSNLYRKMRQLSMGETPDEEES
jgi:transcriptional regulator with GAF, ATPase, and Fis domain